MSTPAVVVQPSLELNDGTSLPAVGLGTFGLTGDRGVQNISSALASGYRLIDSAVGYDTEREVGRAIRAGDVPRDEIVVTTKLRRDGHGYDAARRSVHGSLDRLGLEHVDLYLIHWPNPWLDLYVDTWRALIAARDDGEIRSIGVSNFNASYLERIIEATGEVPAVNQIELHPLFPQAEARALHRELGIQTQSWSPLGIGSRDLLATEPIATAARRHGVTPAQVVLRWHQLLGSVPIPRSSDPGRQRENLELGQIDLTDYELAAITALGRPDGRLWGGDPETTGF